jgi:hypothetical protein
MTFIERASTTLTTQRFWVVFLLGFVLYFVSSGLAAPTAYNNYALLADAFLHGHPWIGQPSAAIDAVTYLGKYYVVEAPMPAILMMPLALFWGAGANQTLVGVFCGAVALAASGLLLTRMGIKPALSVWLLIGLALGTNLWWCTAFGAVWMFAHVATVMFLMLCLAEWYGKRRYWLVGLLLGCAVLSRFPTLLSIPVFLLWELLSKNRGRWTNAAWILAGFSPLVIFEVLYNYARWHVPTDLGFMIFYHEDQNMGSSVGSPFAITNIPFNLYSWLFLAPQFYVQLPWIRPTGFGTALTFTSPLLAIAFSARLNLETTMLWCASLAVAIPALLYFTNGFEQFGMRHTLDFTPFLFCLLARGLDERPTGTAFLLIVVSCIANAYGVWYSWVYKAFSVVPRTGF